MLETESVKEIESVIEGKNLYKKFRGFALDIDRLRVPRGFATALIGENGAGKTTLLNILAGIRLDFRGELLYFGKYTAEDREKNPVVKENIGYTGPGDYYLPQWRMEQIGRISELLFDGFHRDRFEEWCRRLAVEPKGSNRRISALSDGSRMKLMIAGVMARDTELLLMDEPASPLDPLMRDRLCGLIREYLAQDEGNRSVFFSTHNVADMENVTDYVIIMEGGRIAETGFVEELKEKYVLVRGEPEFAAAAAPHLVSMNSGRYGFEGICLADRLDALAGCRVSAETPGLSQICVAVMRQYSELHAGLKGKREV